MSTSAMDFQELLQQLLHQCAARAEQEPDREVAALIEHLITRFERLEAVHRAATHVRFTVLLVETGAAEEALYAPWQALEKALDALKEDE